MSNVERRSISLDRDESWRLYELALEPVDRQIDRQWGATQFFIVLNATVIGGAIALLQEGDVSRRLLVATAFAGGAALSFAGIRAMSQAKTYYRTLVAKKTLIERDLGLLSPFAGVEGTEVGIRSLGSLATRAKVSEMLRDVDAYVKPRFRRGSLTDGARWTLLGFLVFDASAAIVVASGRVV